MVVENKGKKSVGNNFVKIRFLIVIQNGIAYEIHSNNSNNLNLKEHCSDTKKLKKTPMGKGYYLLYLALFFVYIAKTAAHSHTPNQHHSTKTITYCTYNQSNVIYLI